MSSILHTSVYLSTWLWVSMSLGCMIHSSSNSSAASISTSMVVVLPAVLCYGVAMLLETSMHPYDILEAEPELVSGYYVDYGGVVFMLIYLGEGVSIHNQLHLLSHDTNYCILHPSLCMHATWLG